ncbi:MAG: beta-N-acetylhexosaminidase, partial [Verrucomicrobia bacterium]|nr:beta-N-acetylhexosaminidase [Verrucomicrobiota bacterium]
MPNLILLPAPRHLTLERGTYALKPDKRIVLSGAPAGDLLFAGQRLRDALRAHARVEWTLAASAAGPADEIGATLRVDNTRVTNPEGYELDIRADGINIVAGSPRGAFYAICTLIQLLITILRLRSGQDYRSTNLPCLHISDYPDFSARGVMLDISRDKVPTMETLYALVDLLASWKINQFQLYTEHTFAYRNHREVWDRASPMTGQEILELDAFCRERFVELVPNQNSFGHMRRWLVHDRYRDLAECPDGCDTAWGHFDEPFSLNPTDPRSLELIRGLYDELLPHFSSTAINRRALFNVGCDETVDLGRGRSQAICAERGAGRVYLDFLLQIYRE